MPRLGLGLIILGFLLGGCGSNPPETPNQAIQSIIQLYEARDFDTLIRTRYAELHKAKDEAQVQSLIERFRIRFGEQATLDEAVATYRTALNRTPEMSGDGTVATYDLDDGSIKLYRMPSGVWGFHL